MMPPDAISTEDAAEARALLIAARDGGEPEFTALAMRYHGLMMKAACAIAWNPSDAEEAVQDALVAIWQGLRRLDLDGVKSSVAWIFAVTQNCARVMFQRRRALKRGGPDPSVHDEELIAHFHDLHRHKRGNVLVHEPARHRWGCGLSQYRAKTERLMGEIPPEYVSLLDLVYCKGQTPQDVARQRGVSVSDAVASIHSGLSIARHFAARLPDEPSHGCGDEEDASLYAMA